MKMKLSIFAVAVGMSTLAFATDNSNFGSVQSQVSGRVGSWSEVNNVGQFATHRATAVSANVAGAGAAGVVGNNFAVGVSGAGTVGGTLTNASGTGPGAAGAAASQYGLATVDSPVMSATPNSPSVEVGSLAVTGTWSTAEVVNGGAANSGSLGYGYNVSGAAAGRTDIGPVNVTGAIGGTTGKDGVKTWGTATSGDSVNAYAYSGQEGFYNASAKNAVKSVDMDVVTPGTPGNGPGVVKGKCNNGNGNGSEGCSPGKGWGANDDEGTN